MFLVIEDATMNVKETRAVASNPTTSTDTLTRLAVHTDATVRADVAANLSTPVSVLLELLSDVDPWVSAHALTHPSMPVEVLTVFAVNGDWLLKLLSVSV